ncbi:MAG: hypothetical protein ACLUAR_16920 [Pilosibacter sp.]
MRQSCDGRSTDRSDCIYSGGLPGAEAKTRSSRMPRREGGSDEDSLEETEDTALPETDGNVLGIPDDNG